MLLVSELYICNLGGLWSHGRHQRPKTAAAFSLRAAIFCWFFGASGASAAYGWVLLLAIRLLARV